ncbi:MAG: heme exporter protein CcmB [Pseudobacteriovorax sp.]|nr:heme exporter protein CcmB [Pseudobacteriovorax sp.]
MKLLFSQTMTIVRHGFKIEWANPERWLSPILFAITMLILFSFSVGTIEGPDTAKLLVAETYLTAFFSLQISFARFLEPDQQDGVFSLLRTYPLSGSAWYLGKYITVMIMGLLILIPTIFLTSFLHAKSGVSLMSIPVITVAVTALSGMAALGVLLSTMTMGSGSKQILYPLLYFPLTAPVLISAVEASKSILVDNVNLQSLMSSWLGLLLIFGVMSFTLGILLFGELVKAE